MRLRKSLTPIGKIFKQYYHQRDPGHCMANGKRLNKQNIDFNNFFIFLRAAVRQTLK
jgi:hypothetical protein